MRILVVEDEHKIANSLKKGLEQESYVVDLAYDGIEEYDVIILDLMLPQTDGITICQKLRAEKIQTPILILTAKGELDDKVQGLNAGADDYLIKPFAFEELLARIRALSRRPKQGMNSLLTYEDLSLDTQKYLVLRAGEKIKLSRKEFSLLEYLMRHPEQILTKDQIISHVWNYESDILPNTVEVYIGYLRKKIDEPFNKFKPLIKTVRGYGYKLCSV
jgi:DNA-binding response OmpR family regulator